jgi:hypothetical protein
VQLASGGNAWSSISDRNVKENFTAVDGQEVLASVAEIPISTWNLKSQDPSIRHMGPMAQDFAAAFPLGEDDRHIDTIDADGVALAAIQGLYQAVQERDRLAADQKAEISDLQEQVAALQQQNASLDARLSALEKRSVAGTVPWAQPGSAAQGLGMAGIAAMAGLAAVRRAGKRG